MVICPGLGRDGRLSYTTFRRLASELAQANYPTLRFDYPGTGDSEDFQGADPAVGWMQGVDKAISFLRETGVRRIVLCGFRLGALFALLKSTDHDGIDDVVMIDPVVSGARFLREVSIAASIGTGEQRPQDPTVEIDGVTLVKGSASPLYALDAFALAAPPTKRLLLLGAPKTRKIDQLAAHMQALGTEVTRATFEFPSEFSSDGRAGNSVDLDVIREWLPATKGSDLRLTRHFGTEPALGGVAFHERPLSFGVGLFGILCRPRVEAQLDSVVVIGNGGAGPRYGSARFHVFLARRLAANGIASLRFDFAGLGDSSPAGRGAGPHIYETDREPDMRAAIDALACLGYRGFVAAGVCSGGYHAWRATLKDERIEELVMVNPTTFLWHKGQSLDGLIRGSAHSASYYLDIMSRGSGWSRLLRRQFSVRRIVHMIRAQAVRRLSAAIGDAARLVSLPGSSEVPLQAMRRLSRRGVRVLVVMAEGDGGLDVLSAHFGARGRRLTALPGNAVKVMRDLDHSVTRRAMQEDVAEAMLEFLNVKPGRSRSTVMGQKDSSPILPVGLPEDIT